MRRALTLALVLAAACGADDDGPAPATRIVPWPAAAPANPALEAFPEWSRSMKLWPFDVLVPNMGDAEIDDRVDEAAAQGADALIFYVEEEHMYGTFVDEAGFAAMFPKIERLTARARGAGLHTIVYVNGLEVMTRGAFDGACEATGVPTMASEHPDWLQIDMEGQPIVFRCQDSDWLDPDWEDAWVSPLSGYRGLFTDRIASLAGAGIDGLYVDATFLPGFQEDDDHPRWGTVDPAFAAAFTGATGHSIPAAPDLADPAFRAFLAFRHQVLADYLGALADAASAADVVSFWESSTNDTPESTLLGNETAVTGRAGLGFSPEIEHEGDLLAAFRQAKAARELDEGRPTIDLFWPEDAHTAAVEHAIALAQSGTYYPTADSPVPDGALAFVDELRDVLDARVPYAGDVALLYSVTNKDLAGDAFFDAYVEASEALAVTHVPYRIVTLADLDAQALEGIGTVVEPGVQGLSDEHAALLASRQVAVVGDEVGTRDEDWAPRGTQVDLGSARIDVDEIGPALPFHLEAPEESWIEWWSDRAGAHRMFGFVVSPETDGEVILTAAEGTLDVQVRRPGRAEATSSGAEVAVPIQTALTVLIVSGS